LRLKRQYVALMVVAMLVVTALLASMMSQYAQGGRIAYVSVRMDKDTYSEGEKVTFKFVPLTQGVYFNTTGISPYDGNGYVHIIRIPDGVDPDQIIQDRKMLDKVQSWDDRDMAVSYAYFDSTEGVKSLEWNATMMNYQYLNAPYNAYTVTYAKALAGYYLVYPQFESLAGHTVRFQLDRSAIFYLDTLKMSAVPGVNGTMVTYNMTVSAPASMVGSSHCRMAWSINGMDEKDPNGTNLNRAEFDILPGGSYELAIEHYSETIAQHFGMDSYHLRGWIDTAWGNYSFDQMDWLVNGRWYDSPQYYYG
jgi:hypothetical protein